MKTIIYNNDNLTEKDVTETIIRVKILLTNSNNEILLGYSHNEYQFIGGHVEENEDLIQTIKREIKEETGIEININKIEPFIISKGYYKDWPEKNKNRKIEIYYYIINTDEKPNLNNTKYTDHEKDGNFELRYINLDNIEEELINNKNKYGDPHGITKEMLEVIKLFKNHWHFKI